MKSFKLKDENGEHFPYNSYIAIFKLKWSGFLSWSRAVFLKIEVERYF